MGKKNASEIRFAVTYPPKIYKSDEILSLRVHTCIYSLHTSIERLFMDIEREQVKESLRRKEHRRKINQ